MLANYLDLLSHFLSDTFAPTPLGSERWLLSRSIRPGGQYHGFLQYVRHSDSRWHHDVRGMCRPGCGSRTDRRH